MNDGREDPEGRFWYSSMPMNGDRPDGEVYFDPLVGKSITMFRGLSIPNAICLILSDTEGFVLIAKKVWFGVLITGKNSQTSVYFLICQINLSSLMVRLLTPGACFGMRNGVVRVYLNIALRDNLCVHSVFPHLRLPPRCYTRIFSSSLLLALDWKTTLRVKPMPAIFSLLSLASILFC